MPDMKIALGPENADAVRHLPPARDDGSGVGINYADAYIKPIKATLEDGRKVAVKRKGLKITFTIGGNTVTGVVNGNTIEGTVTANGKASPWRATKAAGR